MCNNVNLAHFFEAITKSDFHFTKLLVWDKQNKICGTYYMGQIEFIFLLRKGGDRPINNCGTSDLLSFPNVKDKVGGENIHNSQKPINLFRTMIVNSTNEGDVVLDPFMGSGTTALACIKENRKYVGFEIDSKYYDTATTRIKDESRNLSLF